MKKRVIAFILPIAILGLALALGSVLMLRLFSLMVLVLLLSYFWMLLGIHGLTGQVKKPSERFQVGEWFSEEITVSSHSWIPKLLVKVQENANLPGRNNVIVLSLPPKGSHRWQAELYCRRRGQYRVGTLTATVTDPFGLFSRNLALGKAQDIIVYPATLKLPFFRLLSGGQAGTGSSQWLAGETGPSTARVREYTSGDTLHHIHWPSTAHTGKLMVKEFEADRSNFSISAPRNIWVVLDMSEAAQAGTGDDGTEEYGVTIAASLVKDYIDDGRQVGLIASGEKAYLFLPQTEANHYWQILEALALMKATGDMPVEQLISQEADRFGSDSIVIVITPAASERLVTALRKVKSRGATVIVILLDAASFGGKDSTAIAGTLASAGSLVCTIRKGEELTRALDSQVLTPR